MLYKALMFQCILLRKTMDKCKLLRTSFIDRFFHFMQFSTSSLNFLLSQMRKLSLKTLEYIQYFEESSKRVSAMNQKEKRISM